jgi:hypothetical protein
LNFKNKKRIDANMHKNRRASFFLVAMIARSLYQHNVVARRAVMQPPPLIRGLATKKARPARKSAAATSSNKGWMIVGGSIIGVSAFTWAVTGDNELGAPIRES